MFRVTAVEIPQTDASLDEGDRHPNEDGVVDPNEGDEGESAPVAGIHIHYNDLRIMSFEPESNTESWYDLAAAVREHGALDITWPTVNGVMQVEVSDDLVTFTVAKTGAGKMEFTLPAAICADAFDSAGNIVGGMPALIYMPAQ